MLITDHHPAISTGRPMRATSPASRPPRGRDRIPRGAARSEKGARCCKASPRAVTVGGGCISITSDEAPRRAITARTRTSSRERGVYCLNIGGVQIDRAVSEAVLDPVQPAGLEAALRTAERIEADHDGALEQ